METAKTDRPIKKEKEMEGNQMKMREALESARNWCLNRLGNASYQVTIEGLLSVVDAALSAPARQCDVGTAEEQAKRFREFCRQEKCGRYRCRSGCKAICIERCAIDWAQTPYAAQEGAGE